MPIEYEGKLYPSLQERDAEWGVEGNERIRPQCQDCIFYNVQRDNCLAFPEPGTIPLSIRTNDYDHRRPYPTQAGDTRWTPNREGIRHPLAGTERDL